MDLDESQELPSQQHDDEDDDEDDSDDDSMADDGASKDTTHMAQTPPCSPVKSLNNSSSPVGINRRWVSLIIRGHIRFFCLSALLVQCVL